MTDAGVAVAIDADVPDDALDTATEAKDGCPVGAIEEAEDLPDDWCCPVCGVSKDMFEKVK